MAEQAVSPMMQQYFEIKKQHPNEILFYRVGDFYEMFYDDALTASRELELTLTGKNCGKEERAPMCGVPFHSYETYMARLVAKGYKVAICEQMEDPALAKGLVKRDIIRVVTPGTVIESSMLSEDKNNYLASIYCKRTRGRWRAGVCFADVSTGEAYATELNAEKIGGAIITELCRYMPSEILICPPMLDFKDVTTYIKQHTNALVELREDACFKDAVMEQTMADQFGADWRTTLGYEKDALVPYAVAALLNYLHETQKHGVERIKTVQNYADAQYMRLSPVTRANLELTETMRGREKRGTLLWVLDKTETSMGKRLLRSWIEQPLVDADAINARLCAVQALYSASIARADLKEALGHVFDIERLTTRILYGSATPREVKALGDTCAMLPQVKAQAAACGAPLLTQLADQIDLLEDVLQNIQTALVDDPPANMKDGGAIRAGFNSEVDELRDIMHGGKGYLSNLEARYREETGIPKLKIGFNKVFGYYLEVTNSFKDMVPDYYTRKQTLTNAERYITPELKELEDIILGAEDKLFSLEYNLFSDVREQIAKEVERIQKTAKAVATIDVFASLALVAERNNYVCPKMNEKGVIDIKNGRHPVVEQMIENDMFIANDTYLDNSKNRISIITGPNMAGKSTYMRQSALIVLMAQIGSFVPASSAKIGIVDRIFTRVGASDDLASGQSTFMVEMTEVANILRNATSNSLLILDEIGRGTSTFDGLSIAWAVVEHIANTRLLGAKTLFATHYHELTELQGKLSGVNNYCIAVKEKGDDIVFLRKIVKGGADKSYGIQVAKLAGVPDSVIERAKELVEELSDADITERAKEIEAAGSAPQAKTATKVRNRPKTYDQVDMGQMALFDTAKDEDILKELSEMEIASMTPLEALNTLNRLQSKLKNRWSVTGVQG